MRLFVKLSDICYYSIFFKTTSNKGLKMNGLNPFEFQPAEIMQLTLSIASEEKLGNL